MNRGSIFNSADWVAITLFFVGMLAIVWAAMRKKVKDGEGYFLSARDEKWLPIGTSIFTSNIGSEHLVGLAGAGFATGMAMAHWEMHAWWILILGWVFVPIYDRIKVFTMPEFLELRYSKGSRSILSFLTIASMVLTKIAATLYAADVVFKVFLGCDSINIFGHQVDMFWVIALGLAFLNGYLYGYRRASGHHVHRGTADTGAAFRFHLHTWNWSVQTRRRSYGCGLA